MRAKSKVIGKSALTCLLALHLSNGCVDSRPAPEPPPTQGPNEPLISGSIVGTPAVGQNLIIKGAVSNVTETEVSALLAQDQANKAEMRNTAVAIATASIRDKQFQIESMLRSHYETNGKQLDLREGSRYWVILKAGSLELWIDSFRL